VFKNYILSAVLLIPSNGFSQNRERGLIHPEGFSIKADALSLLNGTINKSLSYSISGELYFNNEYSFDAGFSIERESEPGMNRIQKTFTNRLRWYFIQDDCNCSAFFSGIYFNTVTVHQSVDHHISTTHAVDYSRFALEGGLSGGYQVIFKNHFIVDPAVKAGLEFYHALQHTESGSNSSGSKNGGLILNVQLGIGYRF
jgi:hypothetical protein